ncbi:hypothetical protein PHLCEN_2v11825 [Hermanssonia centrifuga]|uniref:F-box domain-containing protein n=1 Tax=Hermanssonia centrifuga TaxID=98765 RepID=A0A2R6NIS3_9APHY|nr:hypothetical protein PHLCEN_2v11825 [Hermanssonia centrifuga]
MAVAGPTDIPPELVFHVVECLLPVKFDAWLPRCDRLTLARCSLVCTYWSTLFRSVLFKRLELWAERDVYTLQAFIDSPTKNLIHRLVLHPTPTRWIPLIPALIQDLPNCHRVEMVLEKHFLGHTAAPFFRAPRFSLSSPKYAHCPSRTTT